MTGKLVFFALGFVLGTRTGRDGIRQALSAARWVLQREEVRTALGLARSSATVALERAEEYASRHAA
ncbi:MAG: hypothetical protein ACREQM_07250 [Candidatus Dormibacteraceae bacterium]